jgi:hypothetical protein
VIALFVALGGTAIATHPGGQNTISTADIINGEVRNGDLGADAVGTGKIVDGAVKSVDLGGDAVDSSKIADGGVRSADVLNDNLTVPRTPSHAPCQRWRAGSPALGHALCPTCHARVHYSADGETYNADLQSKLALLEPS